MLAKFSWYIEKNAMYETPEYQLCIISSTINQLSIFSDSSLMSFMAYQIAKFIGLGHAKATYSTSECVKGHFRRILTKVTLLIPFAVINPMK